jgi:hypothetical protein
MFLILRKKVLIKWLGSGAALSLAVSAWLVPIGVDFRVLLWNIRLEDQLLVFGRRFILDNLDRPLIVFLFLLVFFWFFILDIEVVPVQLIPLGLIGLVLILTSYAVEPIFYGALFIGFLTLVFSILLSPPGKPATPGVYRYLITQILGIIFILFAAWLASWVDFDPGENVLLFRSVIILSLGFSILLAVFPFTSWIFMISEQNHPYLSGFVMNLYLTGVVIYALRFITDPGWIQPIGDIQGPFQIAGVLMVGLGAISAVFSDHLGRVLGSSVTAAVGRWLLAVSLINQGNDLLFGLMIIQALGIALTSLSLSLLNHLMPDLDYDSIKGAGRMWPGIAAGAAAGLFSTAGFPLIGGFPLYWELGSRLVSQSTWIAVVYFLGNLGLILAGIRVLAVLSRPTDGELVLMAGSRFSQAAIIFVSLLLMLLGLFPSLLQPGLYLLANVY